ncbi:hypothetical protein CWE08_11825 [Aliidiomarina iranensis]|uniref:Uncharacterized protein n=1 Tax=Aliidiomarina iranensis TaxID=1434071 RepID=A0A432VPR6_9GAMM|nr:hypothetical protein [Aliidiomarina iranensis]RUO18167.1 hypothetical protein CWE08_11825 [Aliidiomarina iranensis]
MSVKKLVVVVAATMLLFSAVGCAEKMPQTWPNEVVLLFNSESYVGSRGEVVGYLTEDSRLWLYPEDAKIQRIENSAKLQGVPEEVLTGCSNQFVRVRGTLIQAHPVVLGEITSLVPNEQSDMCTPLESGSSNPPA